MDIIGLFDFDFFFFDFFASRRVFEFESVAEVGGVGKDNVVVEW